MFRRIALHSSAIQFLYQSKPYLHINFLWHFTEWYSGVNDRLNTPIHEHPCFDMKIEMYPRNIWINSVDLSHVCLYGIWIILTPVFRWYIHPIKVLDMTRRVINYVWVHVWSVYIKGQSIPRMNVQAIWPRQVYDTYQFNHGWRIVRLWQGVQSFCDNHIQSRNRLRKHTFITRSYVSIHFL